jgi:DNA-binding MarR family transcriptional regulator
MSSQYDLHASIGYRLTYAARLSERRFEALLAPLGLSRVKWCVLLAVGQMRLAAPSDIAAFVGIDRTATSRALRALDADGYVTRQGGRDDRRTTRVALTPTGSDRLASATEAARRNNAYFRAKLSAGDLAALETLLDQLTAGESRPVKAL